MREVIRRRYTRVLKDKLPLPDLIIVDGGKGQMSAALDVLENELGLDIGLICGNGELTPLGEEMVQYGADRVVTVAHENLQNYTSEGYGQAVMAVIAEQAPDAIPKETVQYGCKGRTIRRCACMGLYDGYRSACI